MARGTPLQLSRLRDIGFREWDPIGILAPEERWPGHPAAGEYDSYLLRVACLLRAGAGEAEAARYLVEIESEHMGLGTRATARQRAIRTVSAIRACLDAPAR